MSGWRDDRIRSAARGDNPTVLRETPAGYAVIGDVQFLPGYSVLLSRDPDATALADLDRIERVRFLADVDLLATAVQTACADLDPAFRRVNIEILGNRDHFVHAHVFPRYDWEAPDIVAKPVWLYGPERWRDPATALAPRHAPWREAITAALDTLSAREGVEVSRTAAG